MTTLPSSSADSRHFWFPQRDVGFQLAGDIFAKRLSYQVGIFNGVADNALADAAVSNHRRCRGAHSSPIPSRRTKESLAGLGLAWR